MDQASNLDHQTNSGRFELNRNGKTSFLEYRIGNGVLTLIHTEVPAELRGECLGSELARMGLDWARRNNLKVRVGCPFVASYLEDHPEYSDLVLK